jgi:hypothetical protein
MAATRLLSQPSVSTSVALWAMLTPDAIRQTQEIECQLEILDPIERGLLERLREDRLRCVRPGLLRGGGLYRPSADGFSQGRVCSRSIRA